MKPLAIIASAAFCALGLGCTSGYSGAELKVFDYSSGETINRIPAPGFYREILCNITTSDRHGPSVKSAFFTMAQEGHSPNASLMIRKRDHNGNEIRSFQVPFFSAAWFACGEYTLSSDGKKIAYWQKQRHLRVRDLASGAERVLLTIPADTYTEQLSWPTSGRLIVAFTKRGEICTLHIHVLGLDGTRSSGVFTEMARDYYDNLRVSPDGKWIVAKRGEPGDGQYVIINTATLKIAQVVPKAKTPQALSFQEWSDDSRSLVFSVWSELAAIRKPADFYHYRLTDRSLKHIMTGLGGDGCLAIANGQILIQHNERNLHFFSVHDDSLIRTLRDSNRIAGRRIPGTTRLVSN